MMRKCPKCGSRRVAPILYGMPAFSEELEKKLDNQKIVLGGCEVSGNDPTHHCFGCGKNFGTPPMLTSKYGVEDYTWIVTSLRFCDGGYFGGYDEIIIKNSKGSIKVDIRPRPDRYGENVCRQMSLDEWFKLLNKLFYNLYVHEWKKQYYNKDILDGEQWELEFRLTHRRVRNYNGSNAFPPYWKELKRIFEPFFIETTTPLPEGSDFTKDTIS